MSLSTAWVSDEFIPRLGELVSHGVANPLMKLLIDAYSNTHRPRLVYLLAESSYVAGGVLRAEELQALLDAADGLQAEALALL